MKAHGKNSGGIFQDSFFIQPSLKRICSTRTEAASLAAGELRPAGGGAQVGTFAIAADRRRPATVAVLWPSAAVLRAGTLRRTRL